MSSNINTSFSVDVAESEREFTGYASVQLADNLNSGRSTFAPGDDVYFFVIHSDNVRLGTPDVSAGSMASTGRYETIDAVDTLIFKSGQSNSQALSRPAAHGNVSFNWQGKNLGGAYLGVDNMTVKISQPSLRNSNDLPVSGTGVLVAKYTIRAKIYRLSLPDTVDGETTFTVAGSIPATIVGLE